MGKYDDIINLPHHVSKNHPQMSLENRAAQFAPFAALVGYAEAITASQEIKEDKKLIAEDKKEELEETLHYLNKGNFIEVKYYVASKKNYFVYKGMIKRIDQIDKLIIFVNRKTIPIKDIIDIKLISDEN
ncbi:MAG: YolD-like family protein [Bacilli bacterium]|nr:YolD-like family protein [Bacilli bacterium]